MGEVRRGLTDDLLPHVSAALKLDRLAVVYQPIVEIESGTTFGYEAEVDLRGQSLSREELYERSIEADCLGEMGRALRTMAVSGCPNHNLFFHVHPRELEEGWLARDDDPMFSHQSGVFLQFTESVRLGGDEHAKPLLSQLRDRGISLVVSDLGSGASNLKYIAELHPQIVKLDREMIDGLATDDRLIRLVRAVTDLCRNLDAWVVADGVRSLDELDALRRTGIKFVQGDLIGRPSIPLEPPKYPSQTP